MKKVLILGAGFGGLAAAAELEPFVRDGDLEVTLVDKNSHFSLGFSMQWVVMNRRKPEEGMRAYTNLKLSNLTFWQDEVTHIATAGNCVYTKSSKLKYDYLVIALGAELIPELITGLKENAYNLCDLQSVLQLKATLARVNQGTVTIAVASIPFKCPPAPYEYAFLMDEILRQRRVREKVKLLVTTPEPQPMPVAGKEVGETVVSMLTERGIKFLPGHKPVRIDGIKGIVSYENGTEQDYEILAAMPPHRAPRVVLDSGLANEAGFVPVDLLTLRTSVPNVYAVGDVASLKLPNGNPHPKAGVFAEAQGIVAAKNIIAELGGSKDSQYSGKGVCYIDTGYDRAAPAEANLLIEGGPNVILNPASEDGLRGKREFERDRFMKWFGG
jgi:sulfide:quinone oxidoreductase